MAFIIGNQWTRRDMLLRLMPLLRKMILLPKKKVVNKEQAVAVVNNPFAPALIEGSFASISEIQHKKNIQKGKGHLSTQTPTKSKKNVEQSSQSSDSVPPEIVSPEKKSEDTKKGKDKSAEKNASKSEHPKNGKDNSAEKSAKDQTPKKGQDKSAEKPPKQTPKKLQEPTEKSSKKGQDKSAEKSPTKELTKKEKSAEKSQDKPVKNKQTEDTQKKDNKTPKKDSGSEQKSENLDVVPEKKQKKYIPVKGKVNNVPIWQDIGQPVIVVVVLIVLVAIGYTIMLS